VAYWWPYFLREARKRAGYGSAPGNGMGAICRFWGWLPADRALGVWFELATVRSLKTQAPEFQQQRTVERRAGRNRRKMHQPFLGGARLPGRSIRQGVPDRQSLQCLVHPSSRRCRDQLHQFVPFIICQLVSRHYRVMISSVRKRLDCHATVTNRLEDIASNRL